jgi:HSP20 family protein
MSNAIELSRKHEMPAKLPSYKTFMPLANVYETDEAYIIIADMPGVDDKSVDIFLNKNVLKIHGTVKPLCVPEGLELIHAEYEDGNYERSFNLSNSIDAERIDAKMRNGVLRVNLPKAESEKTRRISVRCE